jgi:hypothetical protein
VSVFFGGCGKISAIFFIAFFKLPLLRNAKSAIKQIEQNNRGRKKKKTEG